MLDSIIPNVIAYSGISQPVRTYSDSSNASHTLPSGGSGTDTVQFTVTDNGVLQGFLAELDLSSVSAGMVGVITIIISRNGSQIFQQTMSIPEWNATTGQTKGILMYETLNFLAGAEIFAGEIFKLSVSYTIPGTGSNWTWTPKINATILAKARQFII